MNTPPIPTADQMRRYARGWRVAGWVLAAVLLFALGMLAPAAWGCFGASRYWRRRLREAEPGTTK